MNTTNSKELPSLYYISQGKTNEEHLYNIEQVCKSGIKLVQLRLKEVTDETYLKVAEQAKQICTLHKATLVINDSITVAKQINVGVHLGKEDEDITKAKQQLKDTLVGGTANTIEDCLVLINKNVDYIGLGPFKFTETKKKLSPFLGLEGYKKIISELKKQRKSIPIYAIGGIKVNDFEPLFNLGIHGVAVSGLLSNKEEIDIRQVIQKSTNLLKTKKIWNHYK